MLATHYRLNTAEHWEQALNNPSFRFACSSFLILAKPNFHKCSRLGVSVSKRRIKNAVERNKFKRKFRAWFYTQILLTFNESYDFLIFARPDFKTVTKAEIDKHLYNAQTVILKKLNSTA